jgi:predicted MFS family arabinose efflux permease
MIMVICSVTGPGGRLPMTTLSEPAVRTSALRRRTVPVLAVAGAVTVSNVYFPQPLLDAIARGLDVSERSAGLVSTAAQIGYAVGIVTIIPLADAANLRRLARLLLVLTSAALLAGAVAPDVAVLVAATLLLSTTTVLPQLIMPAAASLSGPGGRSRLLGIVSTCLTLGSMLSRTVSGGVAEAAGTWRAAYLLSAVLTGSLAFVLPGCLPERLGGSGATPLPYRRLLASLPGLLTAHRELRLSVVLGIANYAVFGAFWTVLSFRLAGPPFDLEPGRIGLFGLYSLPGALLSFTAGRVCDRYGPGIGNAAALVAALAAFALFGLDGASSTVVLVIGSNLLALGLGSGQVANQTRIFALSDRIRGRLNTVLMLLSFTGGAAGTVGGLSVYSGRGWAALMAGCFALLVAAAAALAVDLLRPSRRSGRAPG